MATRGARVTPFRWFLLWNSLLALFLLIVRHVCAKQVSRQVKGMRWTWVSNDELLGWHERVCRQHERWRAALRWSVPVVVLAALASLLILMAVVGWGILLRPH